MGSKFGTTMRLIFLICCLSLIEDVKSVPNSVNKVRAAVNVINDITTLVLGIDGMIDLIVPDHSDEDFKKDVTEKLDNLFEEFKKIDVLAYQIADINNALDASTALIIWENALEEDKSYMLEVKRKMNLIQKKYEEDFVNMYDRFKNFEDEIIEIYISSLIDNDVLKDLLRDILFAVNLPKGTDHFVQKNIFDIGRSCLQKEKRIHQNCNSVPGYDKLFYLYESVVKTVTKGYTMIILAYQYRKLRSPLDKDFYKQRQLDYQNIQKQAIINITDAASYYLSTINKISYKSSYACDPKTWKEGINYIRVKNYVSTSFNRPLPEPFDTRNPVEYDCRQYAQNNFDGWIYYNHVSMACLTPFLPDDVKAHKPIRPGDVWEIDVPTDRLLSRSCISDGPYSNYLSSSCDEDVYSNPLLSIRKLSLKFQSCNIDKNETVTSARFYQTFGIISIELQCGTFVDGKIDSNSLRWNTDDRNYTWRNHPNYIGLGRKSRTFNLDDIKLPRGEFVTGAGFEVLENDLISLVLQGRKMYGDGNKIKIGETHLRYPDKNSTEPRQEMRVLYNRLAVNQTSQTYEISKSGTEFVNVTFSGQYWDHGHYVPIAPFFDMSSYTSPSVAPLGGLGLIHKSVSYHTGFLSFKFLSPKYMHHIDEDYAQKLAIKSR